MIAFYAELTLVLDPWYLDEYNSSRIILLCTLFIAAASAVQFMINQFEYLTS